jgi:hydrogenase maturation factor
MKPGKVTESVLKRSVLKLIEQDQNENFAGPAIGEDCGLMNLDGLCAFSMDPVIGSEKGCGSRAIHVALNNLAASGAKPVAVMVSILLPIECKEKDLKQLMREIDQTCRECEVFILGGHTQSTKAVNEPVITITGIGQSGQEAYSTSHAKPGQDIVMTKYAAMEGSALIASNRASELKTRYSTDFLRGASEMMKDISILKEAEIAKKCSISAMHDVHQGGVYGALWELTSAAGIGMEIYLEEVPIRQETVEICEFYDLNPYKLLSGGSLLIVAENGHDLVRALENAGVPAAVIGKTTKEQSRIVVREGEPGFLEPPKSDEIYKLL